MTRGRPSRIQRFGACESSPATARRINHFGVVMASFTAASLDAEDLLDVGLEAAGRLFPAEDAEAEAIFHLLMKRWHPDRCEHPLAGQVTSHIISLYQFGVWRASSSPIASGRTGSSLVLAPLGIADWNRREFEGDDGRTRSFRVRLERPFELGTAFLGDSFVLYLVGADQTDLCENGVARISSLRYADAAMRREMGRVMPTVVESFRTVDGERAVLIAKGADEFPAEEVQRALGGSIEPRHVAWMISGLLHLGCYLSYQRVVHNALSPATCFVSPSRHSVSLLGGWWYAEPEGRRLRALPPWSALHASPEMLAEPRAEFRFDQDLIRAVGRHLLGEFNGSHATPAAMLAFLGGEVTDNAVGTYREWIECVLPESFGARRFSELRVDSEFFYDEE